MASADCSTSATIISLLPEQVADLVHAGHERTVDDLSGL